MKLGLSKQCVVLSAIALAVSSCGSATGTDGEVKPVAAVAVAPSSSDLGLGKTLPLQARVQDAEGHLLADAPVVWTSANSSIASVSSLGIVTGNALGTVQIAANSQGRSGIATILVRAASVSTIVIQPDRAQMSVGGTTDLQALTYDQDGNLLTDRAVTWSSSNEGIASVRGGKVTGVAPGTALITGTSEGKSASSTITVSRQPVATVTVTPSPASVRVGQTTQLIVAVKDPDGVTLGDRPVVWTSSNETIATVTQSGVVTGRTSGTAVITATSEGIAGQTTLTVSAIPVATVVVTPPALNVFTGSSGQLSAIAKDDNGNTLVGRGIDWSSNNAAAATVTPSGVVVGVAPGTATITATSEGKSGISVVTVTTVPVASVDVSPPTATLPPNQNTQLTATPKDAAGNALGGRTIAWASNNGGVATVSQSGLVTGKTPGTATISATSEGRTGTAQITVTPLPVFSITMQPTSANVTVGAVVNATATPRDAGGNPLTDRVIAWSSSDDAVATVVSTGAQTATVTARGPGSATITAASEGHQATLPVTVSPVPVASVTVTPNPAAVTVGQTIALTATPRDAGGAALTGRVVSWSTDKPSIATVNPATGVVTGVAVGSATITATSEGRTGTSSLTVNAPAPVPVATVTVAPNASTIIVGGTQQLTPTTKDAAGNTLTGRVVTWGSSNTAVATVNASGVVTGVAAGIVTITATSEGKNGTASVEVRAAPVASVTVTPNPAAVTTGQTIALTATPRDAGGAALTGRTVAWSSGNSGIATVNPSTGVVTGVAPGTAIISATCETKIGTTTVTVTVAPVASVTVTPNPTTVQVLGTQTLTATLKDAAGNTLTGRAVTWSSSNTNVATVSTAGVVTGRLPGSAIITARSEDKTGTTTVTVQTAAVDRVEVAPPTATIGTKGAGADLEAKLFDALGNPLSGRSIDWRTSDESVVTVNASGHIKGVKQGTATVSAVSEGKTGSALITVASS